MANKPYEPYDHLMEISSQLITLQEIMLELRIRMRKLDHKMATHKHVVPNQFTGAQAKKILALISDK